MTVDISPEAVERIASIEDSGGVCDLQFTLYAPTLRALSARLAETEAALATARDALNILSYIHDSNPSDAMADVPELEYARYMLGQTRCVARAALERDLPTLS